MTSGVTATVADLDRARDVALDLSGWGRNFHFYQPRNLAFWGYSLLVTTGVFSFGSQLAREYNAYAPAILLAAALFGIYGSFFWWFTVRIDRYAKLPAKLMVIAFLWGGFAATWSLAVNGNSALLALYSKALGQAWAMDWGAALSAPFIEEPAKGIGLLLLIALAPRHVRTAFDGLILGAFIGLGFQIIEDVAYAMTSAGSQFGANQVGASLATIVLRMVSGVGAHIVYSAIFCAGLVYLLGRPAEPRRVVRGLALMLTAMVLHGAWDSTPALAGLTPLATLGFLVGLIVTALVVVAGVYHLTVTRERGFLRDVMAPEAARRVITADELRAMTGGRKARKAHRKAGRSRGERRRARYVLNAAYYLAGVLAASRGADTERVRFARFEVSRIRAGVAAPP
jgi:hypothetical protein